MERDTWFKRRREVGTVFWQVAHHSCSSSQTWIQNKSLFKCDLSLTCYPETFKIPGGSVGLKSGNRPRRRRTGKEMENKADNGFWRLDSAQKVFVSEWGRGGRRGRERGGVVRRIMCKEERDDNGWNGETNLKGTKTGCHISALYYFETVSKLLFKVSRETSLAKDLSKTSHISYFRFGEPQEFYTAWYPVWG